jgi:hypothetical protein
MYFNGEVSISGNLANGSVGFGSERTVYLNQGSGVGNGGSFN